MNFWDQLFAKPKKLKKITPHEIAAPNAAVKKVLSHLPTSLNRIKQYTPYPIDTGALRRVLAKFDSGKIYATYDSSLKGKAFYSASTNQFVLSFLAPNLPQKAIVVHEAVHAYQDLVFKGKQMTVVDAETPAYIAQAIYVWIKSSNKHAFLDSKDKKEKAIFFAAWKVAEDLCRGRGKKPNLKPLKTAIAALPIYQRRPTTRFDGIR